MVCHLRKQHHLYLRFCAPLNKTQTLFLPFPSPHSLFRLLFPSIMICLLETQTACLTTWNTHSDLLVTLHLPRLSSSSLYLYLSSPLPHNLSICPSHPLLYVSMLLNRDVLLLILLPGKQGRTGSMRRGAQNLKSGGSKCKQWHAEQLKRAINRGIEQEREQARER